MSFWADIRKDRERKLLKKEEERCLHISNEISCKLGVIYFYVYCQKHGEPFTNEEHNAYKRSEAKRQHKQKMMEIDYPSKAGDYPLHYFPPTNYDESSLCSYAFRDKALCARVKAWKDGPVCTALITEIPYIKFAPEHIYYLFVYHQRFPAPHFKSPVRLVDFERN